ncbi:prephenate dehydrogenase/arogenate dehydrogenase family protein [Candidatus Latescibacterota bacterium]
MFNRIVIVGVGLIGGSLGLAVRRKNKDIHIIGVSSPAAVKSAVEMGAIDEGFGYNELGTAVRDADIVFLCTPINRIKELMSDLSGSVKPGAIVTDVGSTKHDLANHARDVLPAGVHFIGGHPMTGSEKSGVNASDPFLFQNAIYVLCPAENVPGELTEEFSGFLHVTGARVVVMESHLHDNIAAAISHLPQMIAVTLVNMAQNETTDSAPYLQLAAGGFRDMTRIASSPFKMWDDICRTNSDAIRNALDTFIENLEDLKGRIGTEALGDDFERANNTRANIPKDTKGFAKTLYEVLAVVEDKPGIIHSIAAELSSNSINIKDIEVLKVREGEGGTLRLAFELEEEAMRVVELLNAIGFKSRLRG